MNVELRIVDGTKVYNVTCSENFFGALMVLCNRYGIGAQRTEGLKADGYNAVEVQKVVNKLIEVIR